MPDVVGLQNALGFHLAADQRFAAPRGLLTNGIVIVPVLRLAARIAGGGNTPTSGVGGSASAEAIGVFTQSGDQRRRFCAFSETPPGGSESWTRWWESQPVLAGEVDRRAAEARASADRAR